MSEEMTRKSSKAVFFIQLVLVLSLFAGLSPLVIRPQTTKGVQNIIILPVYTADSLPSVSVSTIHERMEEAVDYFKECSYGQVSISFMVEGWTMIEGNMTDYSTQYDFGTTEHGGVSDAFIVRSLFAHEHRVNYLLYDRVIIVHAGPSGQDMHNRTYISTCHRGHGYFPTHDGRVFTDVSIVSEYDPMGTIAHELGHDFGAYDLYNYNSNRPAYTGIANWGLMSAGGNNGNPPGSCPAHMCVYNKLLTGWIKSKDIVQLKDSSLRLELIPLSSQRRGYRAVRYNLPDGRYYLIEARVRSGYDAALPDEGVLVSLVNETRLQYHQDAVQLQIPFQSQSKYDAALHEGESFFDNDTSLGVRVVQWNEEGITVDVSTSLTTDWVISERLRLQDDYKISHVEVTSAIQDGRISGYGETFLFAAVWYDNGTDKQTDIYKSQDVGRKWEYLFSTNQTAYRVNEYDSSLVYYLGALFLSGRIFAPQSSFVGSIVFHLSGGVSVLNLTERAGYKINGEPQVAMWNDILYLACYTNINGTRGLTFLTLRAGTWNHTFVPYDEIDLFRLSNAFKEEPYVLYRDAQDKSLKLVRFNSTDILYQWYPENSALWEFDLVCSSDKILVTYQDGTSNETFYNNTVFIEIGNGHRGFSRCFVRNSDSFFGLEALSFKNATDEFHLSFHPPGNLVNLRVDAMNDACFEKETFGFYDATMPQSDFSEVSYPALFVYRWNSSFYIAIFTTVPLPSSETEVYLSSSNVYEFILESLLVAGPCISAGIALVVFSILMLSGWPILRKRIVRCASLEKPTHIDLRSFVLIPPISFLLSYWFSWAIIMVTGIAFPLLPIIIGLFFANILATKCMMVEDGENIADIAQGHTG